MPTLMRQLDGNLLTITIGVLVGVFADCQMGMLYFPMAAVRIY